MKKLVLAAILTMTAVTALADTIGTVNGKTVDDKIYKFITSQLEAKGAPVSPMIKEQILLSEALYAAAIKDVPDYKSSPTYVTRMEMASKSAVIDEFTSKYIEKNPVSEAEIKEAYAAYSKSLEGKKDSKGAAVVPTPYDKIKPSLKASLRDGKIAKLIQLVKSNANIVVAK